MTKFLLIVDVLFVVESIKKGKCLTLFSIRMLQLYQSVHNNQFFVRFRFITHLNWYKHRQAHTHSPRPLEFVVCDLFRSMHSIKKPRLTTAMKWRAQERHTAKQPKNTKTTEIKINFMFKIRNTKTKTQTLAHAYEAPQTHFHFDFQFIVSRFVVWECVVYTLKRYEIQNKKKLKYTREHSTFFLFICRRQPSYIYDQAGFVALEFDPHGLCKWKFINLQIVGSICFFSTRKPK